MLALTSTRRSFYNKGTFLIRKFQKCSFSQILSNSKKRSSVRVGKLTRTFLYHEPTNLSPNAPLLIVLHGSTQDSDAIRLTTGYEFERLSELHKFVVVYPDGYQGNWNDARRGATFPARKMNIDDIGFVQGLISNFSAPMKPVLIVYLLPVTLMVVIWRTDLHLKLHT
ncbi:hypothetical protein K7432_004744 [Basidiobolus ranarum]|uniref:Uncharacterized protein n=1 Tax=Basidiobolus ranarum TaxID=34480 RepID=A0ABR2WXU0_9FUNG